MTAPVHMKYLVTNPKDMKWGMAVTTVGSQNVEPGESYPPSSHPSGYLFSKVQGRILNEYQLVYITKGQGSFLCNSLPHRLQLKEGSLVLLFPGEWHSYWPNPKTGWEEFWIGFKGEHMQKWASEGFFERTDPVWHLGLKTEIISLYKEAIDIAAKQGPCYQQLLGGIVSILLGLARYHNQNAYFGDDSEKMERAKLIIAEQFRTITPLDLANLLCMSYSNYRRMFKNYTGLSPARYIRQVRINYVKEALASTNMSIKQIADDLGYCDAGNLFSLFLKEEGLSPSEYRKLCRSVKR